MRRDQRVDILIAKAAQLPQYALALPRRTRPIKVLHLIKLLQETHFVLVQPAFLTRESERWQCTSRMLKRRPQKSSGMRLKPPGSTADKPISHVEYR